MCAAHRVAYTERVKGVHEQLTTLRILLDLRWEEVQLWRLLEANSSCTEESKGRSQPLCPSCFR